MLLVAIYSKMIPHFLVGLHTILDRNLRTNTFWLPHYLYTLCFDFFHFFLNIQSTYTISQELSNFYILSLRGLEFS